MNTELKYDLGAERVSALKQEWRQILQSYNSYTILKSVDGAFEDIVKRHTEPDRFYHRLTHVDDLLNLVSKHGKTLTDLRIVQLAVWFHDAVYDPESATNERDSAEYARNVLVTLGIDPLVIGQVEIYINATKSHVLTPSQSQNQDLAFFVDADLSILASSSDRYFRYVEQIRQEFSHMSPEGGRSRRAGFLRSMLGRDRIFLSPQLAYLEERARENMTCELSLYVNY